MIKQVTQEQAENMKLNVHLKSGECFSGVDSPIAPLGDNEIVVSFWLDDTLMIYPMDQIEHLEMIFK